MALLDDKLCLTPFGRVLIPPRASPWNPALRVIGTAQRVHSLSGSAVGWDQLDRKTAANKISNAKAHLNKIAPTFMTKALLDVVDPTGDLLSWFENIRSLLIT